MLLVETSTVRPVLVESKLKPGVFEMTGVLQRANAKNQNGRIYKRDVLEKEVQKYIDNFVNVGNAYGTLDHADSTVVMLKEASHVVKALWWDGDNLMGKIELLNTPCGNIVKEIAKAGHTIGISSRGTGSVQQTNEGTLMVQPDFELISFDIVSNPSTHKAFMTPLSLNESKNKAGKYDRLNTIINEILKS